MRFTPSSLLRTGGLVAACSTKRQTPCILPRLGIYEVNNKKDNVACYQQTRQLATTMKAVKVEEFGDESKLQIAKVTVPKPRECEVLLRVEAVGINPVEVMIREGLFGDMIPTPFTPGSDCAGVVEKVGPRVIKFKPGDRVYSIKATTGAYAEYCVSPIEYVSRLDDRLTFQQGAAIGLPYTVAYKALFIRAKCCKGETVFVHGASGSVGLAAVQMAKAHGLKVIGSAGSKDGMDLVKSNGADFVVDHNEKNYMDKVKEVAGGSGVNVILEMLANKNLISDLQLIAPRGRIIVIGNKGSIPDFNPSMTMGTEASIMGVVVQTSTSDEYAEMLRTINRGQGTWVKPPIAKEFPMSQVSEAHREVAKGNNSKGKIILTTRRDECP